MKLLLVLDDGYTFAEACRSLDMSENIIRRWVNQLKMEYGSQNPSSKALTSEQQKIQDLETRINRIEWEMSIFKKETVDSIDNHNTIFNYRRIV
ncbi:hypothetical protein BST98_21230 (plasmid) [Photobacterium damselae]|nr:hypothetical protein BST98_21230 [Photobacterium damselae]MBE8127831.1 transposase [Photobacterium damselae subsp. piscicida]